MRPHPTPVSCPCPFPSPSNADSETIVSYLTVFAHQIVVLPVRMSNTGAVAVSAGVRAQVAGPTTAADRGRDRRSAR